MLPDFGIGLGKDAAKGPNVRRPRPSPFVRLLEAAGLVLVAYGLGSYRAIPAVVGAAMIVGSYSVYRRTHPRLPPLDDDRSLIGPDGGSD